MSITKYFTIALNYGNLLNTYLRYILVYPAILPMSTTEEQNYTYVCHGCIYCRFIRIHML
nr:MAG TPA: hypothetical protein [Caudoviricetes sp.]